MHCDTHRRNAVNLLSDTHVLTDRGNDSPAGWIGLHPVQLIVKGQQWDRARHREQNSVCVCVCVCVCARASMHVWGVNCGSTVRNSWESSYMAQRNKHGDSQLDNTTCFMVTSVCSCACVCVCVCSWESVTGGRRKCEKERVKSVLKKGRWAVKCLSAHPTCSHASFKNSKLSW